MCELLCDRMTRTSILRRSCRIRVSDWFWFLAPSSSLTPLSWADLEASRVSYQSLFDKLDANGIVLAGIELGNEINWTDFNGDFPIPGEGKAFSLEDLSRDPEAQQVARGFLQYLKLLAALKEVRDHSKLNRRPSFPLGWLP